MATRVEAPDRGRHGPEFARLLAEVQSYGVRVEDVVEARASGAGPADAGMVYIEGTPVTFPFVSEFVEDSPFVIRRTSEPDEGWALYRDGERLAAADIPPKPRYYELETEDGIPYWQIALLHLDSLASTVIQTCVYWGNDDQCRFCAIERSLEAGRTIPVKKPEQLAEVAVAAKELDHVADVTLTTGTTRGPDKGAEYVARCARAIKEATDLPVQAQFEPPDDLAVLETVKGLGVDTVGIHVESFDQEVLDRIAPAKGRTGVEGYFRCWERAVEIFGPGQVTTYVILGMGEDPQITADRCRRAVDMGVYPFVVPLRPVPGSLMEDWLPPAPDYVESMYRQVVPYVVERGLGSWDVNAGCARCRACSGMSAFEGIADGRDGRIAASFLSSSSAELGLKPGLDLACREAATEEDVSVHHSIRHAVFVQEQKIFPQSDRDERNDDPATIKVLGMGGGIAGGAVRLYPLDDPGLWRGDRLAVLPSFRRPGLGASLVRFAVRIAGERGGAQMVAYIQPQNVEFFRRLGWHTAGEPLDHVGLPHQRMTIGLESGRR